MYNDVYPTLWYHTEYFYCLESLLCSVYSKNAVFNFLNQSGRQKMVNPTENRKGDMQQRKRVIADVEIQDSPDKETGKKNISSPLASKISELSASILLYNLPVLFLCILYTLKYLYEMESYIQQLCNFFSKQYIVCIFPHHQFSRTCLFVFIGK